MKRLLFSCAVAVFVMTGAFSQAIAAARAPSNEGIEYLSGGYDFSRWSCGAYVDQWDRDLRVGNSKISSDVTSTKYMGYVGYDVLRWLNVYVTAGQSGTDIGSQDSGDSSAAIGAGLLFNFIDVDIPDPGLLEDKLRLNASLEATHTSTDYLNDTISWNEIYADVTVALVNDIHAADVVSPDSIALFTGPFFSGLYSSDLDGSDAQEFGWTVGGEIFFTKRVSLTGRYLIAGNGGYSAGVNVRF